MHKAEPAHSTPYPFSPFSPLRSALRPPPPSVTLMASSTEAAAALTKEELQAVLVLSELAELILLDFGPPWPPLPESLTWGSRKPRSLPGRPHHQPLMPSPPPPDKERVSGGRGGGGVTAAATLSPTTPLSFQESGGEDVDLRPEPTAGHRKRDSKWMEPQREMVMDSLSNTKSNLDRVIDEHKSFSQSSSPNSSLLRDQHHHRGHALLQQRPQVLLTGGSGGCSGGCGGGGGCGCGCGVVRVGPAAVEHQWAATIPRWDRHVGQWPVHELKPEAAAAASASASASASTGLLPDLNVCPTAEEEQDLVWGWEQQRRQQMAHRAATSALARKRRLQKQREKRRSSHFCSSS